MWNWSWSLPRRRFTARGVIDARAVHPRTLSLHHNHRMAIDRLDRRQRRALLDRDAGPGEHRGCVRDRAPDSGIGLGNDILQHCGA